MGRHDLSLRWRQDRIASLMREYDIANRAELAERLEKLGISQNTIYRTFTKDWRGRVSPEVGVALSVTFAVPFAQLIVDPLTRS